MYLGAMCLGRFRVEIALFTTGAKSAGPGVEKLFFKFG